MGYYTIEARSLKRDHTKIYRGIKAKNSKEAMDIVRSQQDRANRWEYKVNLSKRRERHRPQSNKIPRMPWAVLAKRAKCQHFNVLKQWGPLHYHRMTYMAFLPDDHPYSPFKNLRPTREELAIGFNLDWDENEFDFSKSTSESKAQLEAAIHNHYEGQTE